MERQSGTIGGALNQTNSDLKSASIKGDLESESSYPVQASVSPTVTWEYDYASL